MMKFEAYRYLIIALGGLFGFGVVSSIASTAEVFQLRPVTSFIWRDIETGRFCPAHVVSEPSISQARILDFAGDAAVTINSFDYYNQSIVIGSALRQYFTPAGEKYYVTEVNRSGSPLAFRSNYVVQTAYRTGVANIKEVGFLKGRRFWSVEVPIVQFQQSNVDTRRVDMLLTMLIIALKPSSDNPNGIGIDSINATKNYSPDM